MTMAQSFSIMKKIVYTLLGLFVPARITPVELLSWEDKNNAR
jgi:hypothetical protein